MTAPAPSRTLRKTLGQLALALLNATLLLALAVIVSALMLTDRLQSLAADTAAAAVATIGPDLRERLGQDLATVHQALARLDTLEARITAATTEADSATAAQLVEVRDEIRALTRQVTALNAGLSDLRATSGASVQGAIDTVLAAIVTRLAAPLQPPEDTAP